MLLFFKLQKNVKQLHMYYGSLIHIYIGLAKPHNQLEFISKEFLIIIPS